LACTLVPAFSNSGTNYTLIGASAGVMAIMVTTATVAPFYTINLILIGPVKLVYVVLVYIALDFLFLASSNGGGHFSHLGGALYGFAFARLSTRQVDIQGWLDSFLNRNFLNRGSGVRLSRTHTVSEAGMSSNSKNKPVTQADIDKILDKINTSGYNSLSAKEKDQLFRAHRND
ncbi:MAG: rhomboid family intramembrane serine protease, partial [Bacteroidota bacterium]|nr:rhomboid family intramembrane serine protease [Bacteroidota bacterium]